MEKMNHSKSEDTGQQILHLLRYLEEQIETVARQQD